MSRYSYDPEAYEKRYRKMRTRVFDLAVNVARLHMITDREERDRHLRESERIMKAGGKHLSRNLGVDKEISVEEFYSGRTEKPGT